MRLSRTEFFDILCTLLLLSSIALRATKAVGTGPLLIVGGFVASAWYFIRLAKVINGEEKGLPKLYQAIIWFGGVCQAIALMFHAMVWLGGGNVAFLGVVCSFGLGVWFFLPGRLWQVRPNRVIIYTMPLIAVLSATLWLTPAKVRFRVFHISSTYITWDEFLAKYSIEEGKVVDASGQIIRRATPLPQ